MRYGILGHLEVTNGTGTVPIPHGRSRLLLAVLLVHADEPVASDRLIDALWGETPPPSASKSLHNLISGLRKSLGDGRLITHPRGGYQLSINGDEIDAASFEALTGDARDALTSGDLEHGARLLREALALWRGPAFGELAYETALLADVARLEELRLVAVEDRIDADLALGRHAKLVAELEALIVAHPLRERLRAQLIVALYRSGRQADALRAYTDARRHLVDELGIEPGPALRDLERQVLEQDPALDPPRPAPSAAQAPPARRLLLARPWQLAAAGVLLLAAVIVTALVAGGTEPEPTGAATAAARTGDLLVAIDPATNKLDERVPVGGNPTSVAIAGGAAWVLNARDRTLSRVDVQTGTTRGFSSETNIVELAGSEHALWAAQSAEVKPGRTFFNTYGVPSQLTSFDPSTGVPRATTKLPIPKHSSTLATVPGRLMATDGDVTWVLSRPGWVHRVDTRTGERRTLRLRGAAVIAIAAGDGQVWGYAPSNLVRLDPETGRKLATVPLAASWIDTLAVGEGFVWGTDPYSGVLWRVDPRTNTAVTVDVGPGVDTVAVGAGAVWAASSELGTVSRVDPETHRTTATVKVPGTPNGLAVGAGRVWVSVAGAGQGLPAAGGLREDAGVTALPGPPCSSVLTDERGDPDLLIASHLPFGAMRATTLPMSDAVAFVLRRHKFRAGRFTLGLQACDHASPSSGYSDDPLICERNARLFAENPAVVGVVGPLDSPCAWAMLPILNAADDGPPSLVSPTNSDPHLLRDEPTDPDDTLGELYPTGQRGYARVLPADDYDVAAGVLVAGRYGNGRVFFLDSEVDASYDMAWTYFERAANRAGVEIAGHRNWDIDAPRHRRLAEQVRASGADSVYIAAGIGANSGQVLRDLRDTLEPDVQIIAGHNFLPVPVLYAEAGPAARGVLITTPGPDPNELTPAGRRFVREFGDTQRGHAVTGWDVRTAAATEVLLDAIARSDGTRDSVAGALERTRLADSVMGPLTLDANGEPVDNAFTYVRVQHGRGRQDILDSVEGAEPVGTVDPQAELVGAADR
jgi:DNA-binding SARP family transcriptional activator/ABC-type branched-subunit amino acid transport system substrate-binding protein/streptogramin lyase